jgi:hypothetical protein
MSFNYILYDIEKGLVNPKLFFRAFPNWKKVGKSPKLLTATADAFQIDIVLFLRLSFGSAAV